MLGTAVEWYDFLIYATAAKVYGRGHKGSYNLVSADF